MKNEIYIEDARENSELSSELEELLKKTIDATLLYEEVDKPCFVSVTIVDSNEIRMINKEHRDIDSVTDVLSFPTVNLLDGSDISCAGNFYEDKLILGDVVLCAERAMEQCMEYGHSFEREMGYLTCHSILHLIGYDHMDEKEREIMREKEESVMEILNLKRGE